MTSLLLIAWYTIWVAAHQAYLFALTKNGWDTPMYRANIRILESLCDLQLFTGTATVIAGLARWDVVSFYHLTFITNYRNLALNGFWAARNVHCPRIKNTSQPHTNGTRSIDINVEDARTEHSKSR